MITKSIKTRVKICCIESIEEAQLAIDCGADSLGLVSEMPSGPGVISEELIADISASIPPGLTSVLLTSKKSFLEIVNQHRRVRTNAIQLCNRVNENDLLLLRESLPGVAVIQVVHVMDELSYDYALDIEDTVDSLLLDTGSYKPGKVQLGGTGKTHNWDLSKRIVDNVNIPVFLAGGLNEENVKSAIEKVNPFSVDVCSGVRTNGKLDELKLKAFMKQVGK